MLNPQHGTQAVLLFDTGTQQKLDRADFSRFINHFCEACGTDFNTLSEFLILLAALEDNPSEELAFLVCLFPNLNQLSGAYVMGRAYNLPIQSHAQKLSRESSK